tara:strand:- start:192 stop:1280 length:1089 start_codon:yes stop_codon:yes gene_type:complete
MHLAIATVLGLVVQPAARRAQCPRMAASEVQEQQQQLTHRFGVYIEDTDAFAVVYYANYARFFERAAHDWLGMPACAELLRTQGFFLGLEAMDGVKYAQPALLGDTCEVRGEMLSLAQGRLTLRASIVRVEDEAELHSGRFEFAFRDRDGQIATSWPLPAAVPEALPGADASADEASAELLPEGMSPLALPVVLQADEAGGGAGRLTMHAALRFFERHRTTFIGGPDVLYAASSSHPSTSRPAPHAPNRCCCSTHVTCSRPTSEQALAALQAAGVNVVVARLGGARLLRAARDVRVGDALTLRCRVTLKARNTQVVFEQVLLTADGGEPVARAAITCLCLDPRAGKIVPAPASLLAQLEAVV